MIRNIIIFVFAVLVLTGCDLAGKKATLDKQYQNIRQKVVKSTTTSSPVTTNVFNWKTRIYTLSDREPFQSTNANSFSSTAVFDMTYNVQLTGTIIGNPDLAIIIVEGKSYTLKVGDSVLDMFVRSIDENSITIQRSFRKFQLKVGEQSKL